MTSAPIPAEFLAEARKLNNFCYAIEGMEERYDCDDEEGSCDNHTRLARALHAAHRRGRDEGIEFVAKELDAAGIAPYWVRTIRAEGKMNPVLSKSILDERLMFVKVIAAGKGTNTSRWYLALDAAARRAFDALAEIERTRHGYGCLNDEIGPCVCHVAIARAALPPGWEPK
jgi:hypothetical protein